MIDITGVKIGRLLVLNKDETKPAGRVFWICRCECGTEKSIESYSLRHGKTTSCGCFNKEVTTKRNKIGKHLMSNTPEYIVWTGMKQRCENKNATSYPRYGAIGISVCERWKNSFDNFLEDMGYRPSLKHTLDRIGGKKCYEPGNCRWATTKEQAANKECTLAINIDEVTDSLTGWGKTIGVNPQTLHERIKRGMSPVDAVLMGVPK